MPHHDFHPHHHTHHGFDGRFGRRLGVYYGDAYYYRGPVTGVYSPIDPNLVVSPPRDRAAPPPTVEALTRAGRFDDALALIGARDPDAIGARDHLERALILALAGDLDQAAAAAEAALSADPDALFEPIDGPAFAGSRYTLRRAVVAAVRRAHRTGQARAWQLVASLMHAESRDRLAARMLERAASLGSAAPTAGPAGPG
ncbi:MAG: hypothetical protein D6693_07475 [Planctomycetota bacterium]|nr:MAG: hypothetical protein D6693_07475 [Planctomycetota bacterium]